MYQNCSLFGINSHENSNRMLDLNKRPLSLSLCVKQTTNAAGGVGERFGRGPGIREASQSKAQKIKLSSIFIINATITTRQAISNEERAEGALIKTMGKIENMYVKRQNTGEYWLAFSRGFQGDISQLWSNLMKFTWRFVEQSARREQPVQLRLSRQPFL